MSKDNTGHFMSPLKAIALRAAWGWLKSRQVQQQNKKKALETKAQSYAHFIFDEIGEHTWGREGLFNKWCWETGQPPA